jgi:hypothetical protein
VPARVVEQDAARRVSVTATAASACASFEAWQPG